MVLRGLAIASAALVSACGGDPEPQREYVLEGQILAVRPERREVVIRHQDIEGFMPGMTMPFSVREPELLTGKRPGDLVTATLVVAETSAHLSTLTTTGFEDLNDEAPPPAPVVLAPGQSVSDAAFVDQDGQAVSLEGFRGHRLALTFIYTRCPLPDFCPLMDRHFASIQETLATRAELADVRLLTVTFDPEFDTPAVLKAYARRRGAEPAVWSFLTGDPTEVSAFGEQFGLYVERAPQSIDITHSLRTAVIDPEGRLVTMYGGNSWTPAELIADLSTTPAPVH